MPDTTDLRYKHDPTNITVKRIFQGEGGGGRFYGGFWENMPKSDRLKLRIENGEVCELDYAAFHPTITYAIQGIALTEDPYIIEGCERNEVKQAFLVLFNCNSREQAVNAIRSFGIKNVKQLIGYIEQKHEAIKNSFYNPGFGMHLQNTDAWIAERIIKRLTEEGIVCLPVHDSFITQKIHEAALRSAMEDSFYEIFKVKPIIK